MGSCCFAQQPHRSLPASPRKHPRSSCGREYNCLLLSEPGFSLLKFPDPAHIPLGAFLWPGESQRHSFHSPEFKLCQMRLIIPEPGAGQNTEKAEYRGNSYQPFPADFSGIHFPDDLPYSSHKSIHVLIAGRNLQGKPFIRIFSRAGSMEIPKAPGVFSSSWSIR